MRLLCDEARVVAVDRPGAGWSGPGEAVLPDDVARRLHDVLITADVPSPYVLVGHSLGALHVRAFAAAYPDDTAGLVLLDPTHERMLTVLDGGSRAARLAGTLLAGLLDLLALPIPGASRLAAPLLAPRRLVDRLTEDPVLRERLRRQAASRPALRASIRERRSVAKACASVRPPTAGAQLPVLVVSASSFDGNGSSAAMRDGINRLHADLASRWTYGRHEIAADTTHLLPIEAPSVAADAIRAVLAEASIRPG
jgi:pimeloyl-ACP methyl ester carboxylesterase